MWNDGTAKKRCKSLVDLVGFEPTTSSMPWKRLAKASNQFNKNKALSALRCGANQDRRPGSGTNKVMARRRG